MLITGIFIGCQILGTQQASVPQACLSPRFLTLTTKYLLGNFANSLASNCVGSFTGSASKSADCFSVNIYAFTSICLAYALSEKRSRSNKFKSALKNWGSNAKIHAIIIIKLLFFTQTPLHL